MTPTPKAPAIENLLNNLAGRTESIESNHCLKPPLGCGKPITPFRDKVSEHEYRISGFCQSCQDKIFGA